MKLPNTFLRSRVNGRRTLVMSTAVHDSEHAFRSQTYSWPSRTICDRTLIRRERYSNTTCLNPNMHSNYHDDTNGWDAKHSMIKLLMV